ncbi:hypothetical protein LTR37_016867 [Vermiconidia calcicola]|uniref:Uncharacterized protein n=1 Tax=Vermiconidia calcicola TaxID=1690605 RepID=A0ACC3MMD9_9PEZI|nr:hypothetical protein LTR37_016867 [Vermiconidia calcicola]
MADQLAGESSTGILDLPPELMEEVATYLPAANLLSLRATCKDIGNKVFRVYCDKCFADRTFLLTWPRSMEILERLSAHPQFCKAVNIVRLSFQQIVHTRVDHQRRLTQMMPTPNSGIPNRNDRIQVREMRKLHDKLLKRQKEYRDSGEWQKCLARSLEQFQRRDCALTVEIFGTPHALAPSPSGKRSLERVLGYEDVLECVPPIGSVHDVKAIETVLRSRCQLVGLSLPDFFTRLQRKPLDVLIHMVANMAFAPMESIVRLNLFLSYPSTADHADMLALVLNALPRLKHLRLRSSPTWQAPQMDALHHITTQAFLTVLETLEISMSLVTRQSLINFIEKHNKTLQQVTVLGQPWDPISDPTYGRIMAQIKGHHAAFSVVDVKSREPFI